MNRDKLHTYPCQFPGPDKAVDWVPAFPQRDDQEFIVQESQRKLIKILSTDSNLQKSQSYDLQLHPALRKQSPYPKRAPMQKDTSKKTSPTNKNMPNSLGNISRKEKCKSHGAGMHNIPVSRDLPLLNGKSNLDPTSSPFIPGSIRHVIKEKSTSKITPNSEQRTPNSGRIAHGPVQAQVSSNWGLPALERCHSREPLRLLSRFRLRN